MRAINPSEKDHEGINVQRVFWAAIIYTIVALSSVGLAIFLITRNPTWQVFLMAATTVVSLGLDLTAIILVRRERLTSALKILYWSGLTTVPLNSLLFINITPILAAIVIVIGFVNVYYLFPPSWRKLYPFGPVVTAVLMLILDFIDPPFRIDLGGTSGFFGPVVLVFLIISIAVLVVSRAWAGNYRAKLTTITTTVTLLASGTVAFFIVRGFTQALTQSVGTLLKTNAEARAVQIGDLLNRQIEVLTTLSMNEILQTGVQASNTSYTGDASAIQAELDRLDQQWRAADAADNNDDPLVADRLNNELSFELLKFQSSFPAHAEVFLTDQYGALVASTNRTSDYYQADEVWWQWPNVYKSGLGAVYISTPEFDESVGALSLLIALPIRDLDTGETLGILRTTYLLTALQDLLEVTKIGKTGEADIIFPGETIQHAHEGQLEPIEPEEWEQLQALSGAAYAEMNFEGTPSLVSQARVKSIVGDLALDNMGWLVTVHQPSEEALAPVNVQTRNAVVLGVIIALVASAAAIGLAQVLVAPILRLTTAARQVAGGDLTARATVETTDEVGTLADTFNSMTAQLGDLIGTLEQRVVARTRALETSAEVSRRLSTILDQRRLVKEVVEQLQAAFGYYHAHIYLFDETKEYLVMVGGTGEAGQNMLARGHRIPKGRGLVGRTAETNAPVLVADTSQDPDWLPNPLLPETRSELAVPIAIGDNVLGVLDVQHNVAQGLIQDDVDLIQSIANQVAIAVQNAQAYMQAQRQADRETLIGSISRKIQSTTTIDDVLKVAVSELGKALSAQRSGVELKVEALSSDERN